MTGSVRLPAEVQNLLYVVKAQSTRTLKPGLSLFLPMALLITIRLFPGLQVNRQKLVAFIQISESKLELYQIIVNLSQTWR